MDLHRKFWNQQQQALRQNLAHAETHAQAIELFLHQHAMVHAAEMSNSGLWSFEDDVLSNVTAQQMRMIPRNCDHSIAWLVWHMTRCEDITMNLLAAGSPQVLLDGNWLERMKISALDTGNAMTHEQVQQLSGSIDLEALRSYRIAVGRRTRDIARATSSGADETQSGTRPSSTDNAGRRGGRSSQRTAGLLGRTHHRRAPVDASHPA